MVWNFVLYFLYGLAFFTLGVAILSRDIRLSELGIARIIWVLSAFGISHGLHEWLDLLVQVAPEVQSPAFTFFKLTLTSISFLCLLYFGIFLNFITFKGDLALKTTPVAIKTLIGVIVLSTISIAFLLDCRSGREVYLRLLVAIPSGLLSGIGLIMYARTVRSFSRNVAMNFILAGSIMLCYALASGPVPTSEVIPFLGMKIVLIRGLCAFLITYFTIRALAVFSLEQREIINEKLLRFTQSEKMASLGILAAGIAHEINNPLANVSLNVESLRDLVEDDEKICRKLKAIERNTERASKIARELLHFSREKETALEPTDINQVISKSCQLLKNQKLSAIIRLNLRDVPKIMAIAWKLEEVFINLLINCLDACSERDSINVETVCRNGRVMAIVSDTGRGISAENLANVFDPFFTTKEIGKGTGLGLSVCYNIIKKHGGEISIQSSEPGGTVVTVTLPVMMHEK
jgi:two-component system, NtrC family, sensor kinase